jgi:hypothetical protein
MTSDEVGALLVAAQETEERCRKYNSAADLLDKLTLALHIVALASVAVGVVTYMLYGY